MESPTIQRQTWFVMSPMRTLGALVFFGIIVALLVAITSPFRFQFGVLPWVAWIIIPVLLFLRSAGLRTILLGGCIVDTHARQLIRWWGLLVPFRSRVIPLAAIQSVHLSFGLDPHGIRAAYERDEWYNLAVEIDGRCLLVRRECHRSHAKEFGQMLASLFHSNLVDYTIEHDSA